MNEKAGENVGVVAGGGNCFVVFRLCFYVAVFSHEWDRCGVSIEGGCFGCGGGFFMDWAGEGDCGDFLFLLAAAAGLVFYGGVAGFAGEGGGGVVDDFFVFCGGAVFAAEGFCVGFGGPGVLGVFFGFAGDCFGVGAAAGGARECGKSGGRGGLRARQGRAAMAFQVALRNLILLTD